MKTSKVVSLIIVLMLVGTLGAFAAEKKSKTFPWMASFDSAGQLNLYGSVGFYGLGISADVGPEIVLGNFDIAGIPLAWGAMVRGVVGFSSAFGYASWIDWAAAPMLTLHWGVDFGAPWKFDWYFGFGLSISGSTGTYYTGLGGGAIGFGFANFDGVAWHFADKFALVAEYAYTPYISAGGVGIKWAL